jgi:hypothetical protein
MKGSLKQIIGSPHSFGRGLMPYRSKQRQEPGRDPNDGQRYTDDAGEGQGAAEP